MHWTPGCHTKAVEESEMAHSAVMLVPHGYHMGITWVLVGYHMGTSWVSQGYCMGGSQMGCAVMTHSGVNGRMANEASDCSNLAASHTGFA